MRADSESYVQACVPVPRRGQCDPISAVEASPSPRHPADSEPCHGAAPWSATPGGGRRTVLQPATCMRPLGCVRLTPLAYEPCDAPEHSAYASNASNIERRWLVLFRPPFVKSPSSAFRKSVRDDGARICKSGDGLPPDGVSFREYGRCRSMWYMQAEVQIRALRMTQQRRRSTPMLVGAAIPATNIPHWRLPSCTGQPPPRVPARSATNAATDARPAPADRHGHHVKGGGARRPCPSPGQRGTDRGRRAGRRRGRGRCWPRALRILPQCRRSSERTTQDGAWMTTHDQVGVLFCTVLCLYSAFGAVTGRVPPSAREILAGLCLRFP